MELQSDQPQHILPTAQKQQSAVTREGRALLKNLCCGLGLLFFRRSAIREAVVSINQIAILVCCYTLTILIASYLITPYPVFDGYGMDYLGVDLLISCIIGFALAKISGDHTLLPRFLTLVYSLAPFPYLILYVGLPHLPVSILVTGYFVYLAWIIGVVCFIIGSLLAWRKLKTVIAVTLWLGVSYSIANASPGFWYQGYATNEWDTELDDGYVEVNQEQVYYNQFGLLHHTLKPIQSGVEGVTDLFFVGFGSDSRQDVFMKEISHVQRFMDNNLGTAGRSVALINNVATLDTVPLASASNLKFTLNHLARKMNPDEDVVFLYLTSHGSEDHDLAVSMLPLDLNDLRPEHIKTYFDNAGIRWRIILVSACYAGGFIEPMMDDYSLILTAAAADKTSFGCSNENEFTYFGEALFKAAPQGDYTFIPSIQSAMAAIRERELSEGLPPSEPQLFIGEKMKQKLGEIEQQLARYPAERFERALIAQH